MVLEQYAIVDNGHIGFLLQSFAFPLRSLEHYVVGLPFAGFPGGVHQWRPPTVDRSRLTVRVGLVIPRIEYLHLVPAHQENTAVAAILAFAFNHRRRRPLDVKL